MIKILPLGGCGEIGMNSTVVEIDDNIFLIDAGIGFPSCYHHGVDILMPDFRYLLENEERISAVLLTHGHDDHIGSLPYLFSLLSRDIPIYGGPITLAMARKRFSESDTNAKPLWQPLPENRVIPLEDVKIEFIPVTHSMIESFAIALDSRDGVIIHTGDFKIDPKPLYGEKFCRDRFVYYSNKGVKVLLSDSTNSEMPGHSLPEYEVKKYLYSLFSSAPGRVIFTTFSSHITRIKEVIEISKQLDRKVFVSGRSIKESLEIAEEHGIITEEEKSIFVSDIKGIPDSQLTIIVTGSQGEPFSTLYRISRNEDKKIKIKNHDIIIISAKFIPGQEKAIYSYINNLFKLGAKEVYYEKLHNVHASGHGYQEELREMINLTKPEIFIPIHGEYRHLEKHRRLAMKEGSKKAFILQNGEGVTISSSAVEKFEYPVEVMYLDGIYLGEIQSDLMKKRKFVAREGILVIFGIITTSKEFLYGPKIFSMGIIEDEIMEEYYEDIYKSAATTFQRMGKIDREHLLLIEEEIRISVRRFLRNVTGKNPVVKVILDLAVPDKEN